MNSRGEPQLLTLKACGLVMMILCLVASPEFTAFAQQSAAPENAAGAVQAPENQETTVSPAEQAFREGVNLYKKDMYSEALNEFNRALALDPGHMDAAIFKKKCETKLQMLASGQDPAITPVFENLRSRNTAR